MFTKSRLTAIALISFAATTAMATTNANAFTQRVSTCDVFFLAGCGEVLVPITTPVERRVVRLPTPPRDTSPTYMKQTDPRYTSAMNNAGGGGGGGGGGGSGGGGGGGS
ncbi:hypothetical protein [Bradyrhizobium iriomotense]|uniref:Uncharacterized protein n=1 Tax=Bradyrhizobium iriomotense TaxID=441950 RepID=A0ABQ6BE00_9BRAD|nr:hypothetical protein [Bradyrhizobium iriomotense]GLR91950.1 hypothetical protein GCM10007857_86680 [Bradyrhizobium iriomotense]